MKRFGREHLDVNRAAFGAISGAFGLYMLMKGGANVMEAVAPFALQQDVEMQDMVGAIIVPGGLEICASLGATVCGQWQLAHCVHEAAPCET